MNGTIKTVTVSYSVKRSGSYQSVDASMAMEVELKPGDTPESIFKEAMQTIIPLVETEADAGLREVIRLANS